MGDSKPKNWALAPVEKDQFLGQSVAKFKYWHYKTPEHDLYIPVGKFTLKRIDPDDMNSATRGRSKRLTAEQLEARLAKRWRDFFTTIAKELKTTQKKLLEKFKDPKEFLMKKY